MIMKNKKTIQKGLLIAGILLLLLGIQDHGFQDIRNKANRICYECIGIG